MRINDIKNEVTEYSSFEFAKNGRVIKQGLSDFFNADTKKIEKAETICELFDAALILSNGEKYTVRNVSEKEEALDQLLELLPKNLELRCCHTCRFGHSNPLGDSLFLCLIDEGEITSKEDILNLFAARSKEVEMKGRCKKISQKEVDEYCDRYQKCTSEFYRYK